MRVRARRERGVVRDRWSGPALWCRIFVGLLCLSTLWSLATPLGGGPDEPNHLIRSSALMHGQLVGTAVSGPKLAAPTPSRSRITPYTKVAVSEAYASTAELPLCFVFRVNTPAGCSPSISASSKVVPTVIYTGRYPPFYYAVVGWPTAFLSDPTPAFYVGRLLNGVICCGLLALAFCLALRAKSPRFLMIGVLTAMTPMVLYLSAIINPNSLEVAAALCLWTAAMLLALELGCEMSQSLVRIVVLDAVVVSLVRPDSPLWVVVIAVAVSPIVVRSGKVGWRALGRRRDVRLGAGVVAVGAVASVLWTLTQHATTVGSVPAPPASEPFSALIRGAAGEASDWVVQTVGDFGWPDVRAPLLTITGWVAVTGCMILLALSFARRRHQVVVLLTAVASVVVPLVIVLAIVHHNGFIGAARYFMALFVGIPIVASIAMEPAVALLGGVRHLAKPFVVVLAAGQVAAFWWALHRYLVGEGGPFSPTASVRGAWTPPIPALVLDASFAVVALTTAMLLVRLYLRVETEQSRLDPSPVSPSLPVGAV